MELVYLWVDGYKNIKKQGFNFSPRFECSYDEKTKELTVDEKKDYVSLFPKNINVTAIVGENGSGKSSLIELLSRILTLRDSITFFYILNNGKENVLYSNLSTYNFIRNTDNFTIKSSLKTEDIALINYIDMYYLNISHLERDEIIKNDVVSMDDPINYLGIYAKNDFEKVKVTEETIYPTFSEFKLSQFNFLQVYAISNLLTDKKYTKLLFETFKIKKPYSIQIEYSKEKLETIKILNTPIEHDNGNIDSSVPPKIDALLKFLEGINNNLIIESSELSEFFKLSRSIFNLEKEFKLNFQTKDGEAIKLSAGEKTILFYLERIDFMLSKIKVKNKKDDKKHIADILLFDEIELYLHPMWQKRILNIILEFINIEKTENLLHIIIASHSPFLLSDLPKENVIFLKKDENGNCKNVTQETNIETFGANIHTLLSHGFFMKDGLMGEFAKEKINDIINFHKEVEDNKNNEIEVKKLKVKYLEKDENQQTLKDKLWHIKSIIGESYLKQVIKNHIIEIEKILLGKDEANKEEIKRLQDKIKLLEGKND